jgi:5'-3' exoribonuclease 2
MRDIKQELGGFDEVDPDDRNEWDSNVITPGTEFMHKLSDYLRWYVVDRINRGGVAWRNCLVILSDASEPGEGEHKIMNYIRRQRTEPGYNPNLRHVLHGLDADLIMLGLALHEAHFTVLREEVLFGRDKFVQSKASSDQATFDSLRGNGGILAVSEDARWCYEKPFVMCSIPVLREYLAAEFACLATGLPFEFDFERVIDDFVFICFFVG